MQDDQHQHTFKDAFHNFAAKASFNTGTTIVTFLIVFLIQNTQNRDARAIHLKLDEIIRAISRGHNDMIDIENLSDEELKNLSHKFELIRQEIRPERKTE